jgi:hypothetical protein
MEVTVTELLAAIGRLYVENSHLREEIQRYTTAAVLTDEPQSAPLKTDDQDNPPTVKVTG